jgi:predicted FMN-binding regulatory protein PaiB
MKDMQTDTFIDEPTLKDVIVGVGGAVSMFIMTRFFKSGDSLKERMRKMEEFAAAQRIVNENTLSNQETMQNSLNGIIETIKLQGEVQINQSRDIIDCKREVAETLKAAKHSMRNAKQTRILLEENFIKNGDLTEK